jgi:hypothetical protein
MRSKLTPAVLAAVTVIALAPAVGSATSRPNSRAVSKAFTSLLPSGAIIPASEGPACPPAILPEILKGGATCFAEYKRDDRWSLALGSVIENHGTLESTIDHTGSWRRRRTVCRQHGWRVAGTNLHVPGASHNTLVSNNDCGREGGDSDVYLVEQEMIFGCGRGSEPGRSGCKVGAKVVGWQFTDSAGFTSIGVFPCRHHGPTYTCTNAVGDSFSYTP